MYNSSAPIENTNIGIGRKKNWWRSLRVKIIGWSFVPTVIILSAVAWFTFYSYQKVIGDLAIKQESDVVRTKFGQVTDALGRLFDPVIIPFFHDILYYNQAPLAIRAQYITDRADELEIFDGGIYILDSQGKVYSSWPEQPDLYGEDWSDTPTFRFITDHYATYAFTDLQPAGSNSYEISCVAAAMSGLQGEFVGASYYCLKIGPAIQNTYYKTLNDLNLGPGIFILDGNQRVLFSTSQSEIGKDLSHEAYIQELLNGEITSGRLRNGSIDMVVSYVRSFLLEKDQVRWILLKEQSWAEFMRPTLAYRQLLLVLLAMGVVVPVLVTSYGVRHITEPIQKLIQASEQVTAGQFKHRIEVKTGDEIETLSDQFNLMSEELDESYTSLEKKVADRTRELAILNSIISVASHSLNIQEILEDALNKTVEQMDFDAGSAFKFETGPSAPLLAAHRGFEPAIAIDLVNRYITTSPRNPVYPQEVTTIQIEDFQDESLKHQLSQLGLQLLVYVPLSTKGRALGFFILGRHAPGKLSPEGLSLLSSIGRQVGVAMENARLYEQAEQAAITAERSRLARELHDAVTQTLFSANLIADVIPRIWKRNPEEGLQSLEELRQLTRGALAEMRTLLLEMRPESLERPDLKSLLTQLAEAFIGRVRVPVSLDIQGECELAQDVKLIFYRVAQEALNNIAKHSGARQVELRLECHPDHLYMCIQDDGLGFDAGSIPPGHMGIAIMRERASSIGACLKIESQVSQGTKVELDWEQARREVTDEHASDDPGDVSGRS